MDPISAMIGGGASIIGGLMNTSSQQAINSANLQEQQWAAQGGYLPGLVANAKAAGLSPLAVLGQHAPTIGTAISGDPGSGLQKAGALMAQIDPRNQEKDDLALRLGQANIEKVKAETSQTKVDTARSAVIADTLQEAEREIKDLGAFGRGVGERLMAPYNYLHDHLFGTKPQQIVIPRTPGM